MFAGRLIKLSRATNLLHQSRSASILNSLDSSPVLISSNRDVYTNLALEHWLYNNLKFSLSKQENDTKVFTNPVVLIWTDEPCVVIGRHQNPWVETTLAFINKAGIKLARRHSGGGCVYHDENNINISIIGDRSLFENRQANLKFLAKVLDEKYGVKCEPTQRHDLVHTETGAKMSGSAAKLGRFNCYHHFTLLVDTDKEVMETAIRQTQRDFIRTSSTPSTRSKVINLKELRPELNVDQVISDLAIAYGKLYENPQSKEATRKAKAEGDADEFTSLRKFREELESPGWIYGMTPRFKLEKSLKMIEDGAEKEIQIIVTLNRGLFESFEIKGDAIKGGPIVDKFNYLIGTKFDYKEAMVNVVKMLQVDTTDISNIGSEQIVATLLLQMVHESNF